MSLAGCEELIAAKRQEELSGNWGAGGTWDFIDLLVRKGKCTASQGQAYYNMYWAMPEVPTEVTQALHELNKDVTEMVEEQRQLPLKKQMLESETATFEPGAHEIMVTQVNKEIEEYNKQLNDVIADTTKAVTETASTITETVKKSMVIPIVIAAGVLILIFAVLFRRH